MIVKPVLVLAVGNPSRGDDALGPELAARIEAAGWPGVEVITEFQLQVENALDLEGRERVLFVDAGTGTPAPHELRKLVPGTNSSWHAGQMPERSVPWVESAGKIVPGTNFTDFTTHALSPEAVLATYERITGAAPPESWVLCVRGERFELGQPLSDEAARNAESAWDAISAWTEAK